MARPKFSLRLLLLVVALIAVCIVWLRAQASLRYADWEFRTRDLKTRLAYQEQRRERLLKRLDYLRPNDPKAVEIETTDLADAEADIKQLREQIDGTEPYFK
jgi:hypothetical protein